MKRKLQVAAFLRNDGERDMKMGISPEFSTLDVMGGRKKRKVPVMN